MNVGDAVGVVLGVIAGTFAGRDFLLLRRWDPQFFRRGPLLYSQDVEDHSNGGAIVAGLRVESCEVRATNTAETLIIAPLGTYPLLRGVIQRHEGRVQLRARMNVGHPFLIAAVCWLFRQHWLVWVAGACVLMLDCALERRRFSRALLAVASSAR